MTPLLYLFYLQNELGTDCIFRSFTTPLTISCVGYPLWVSSIFIWIKHRAILLHDHVLKWDGVLFLALFLPFHSDLNSWSAHTLVDVFSLKIWAAWRDEDSGDQSYNKQSSFWGILAWLVDLHRTIGGTKLVRWSFSNNCLCIEFYSSETGHWNLGPELLENLCGNLLCCRVEKR